MLASFPGGCTPHRRHVSIDGRAQLEPALLRDSRPDARAHCRFAVKSIEALPDWAFAAAYGVVFALLLPAMQVGYTPFIYFQV